MVYYSDLFERALKENRPVFVDYFLRQDYNPLETKAFLEYSTIVNFSKRSLIESFRWKQTPPESKAINLDKLRKVYALKFITELYQCSKAPSHVSCILVCNTLSISLCSLCSDGSLRAQKMSSIENMRN